MALNIPSGLRGKELSGQLEFMLDLARVCGSMLLSQHGQEHEVLTREHDGRPQLAVERDIVEYLLGRQSDVFPDYGFLNEETYDNKSRFSKEFWFLGDVCDSTKDYLEHVDRGEEASRHWSFLLALMKRDIPVAAVAYRPQAEEMICAVRDAGAYQIVRDEERKISVSEEGEDNFHLLLSRRRRSGLDDAFSNARVTHLSGAWRAVEVAKGTANLALSPGQMHLWDVGAPSLILEEAAREIAPDRKTMTAINGDNINFLSDVILDNGWLASNGLVHQYALDTLKAYTQRTQQ